MHKIIFLIFLFVPIISYAEEDKSRFWFGTFSKTELSQSFSYWIEGQVRYDLDHGSTNQFLYRTGLLQKKSEDVSFGYLYGYITSSSLNEHRFAFQYVQNYGSVSHFKLSHRMRLEYRTFENLEQTTSRYRYLLRMAQNAKSKIGFVLWDELFINLKEDDISGNTYFDRNRLFIGFSKKHHNARVEFGYLNQFVPRENIDISEHTLVLYIFV